MGAFQRAERKAKELAFAQGEDKKNQDRMSELASKLQGKIKTYKQQIEEAEEIAALNLASSARPSRSSRRPRSAPSSPWFSKLMDFYVSMLFSNPFILQIKQISTLSLFFCLTEIQL